MNDRAETTVHVTGWLKMASEQTTVTQIGYDGTLILFPPDDAGRLQIIAMTGSGSAVRVMLDSDGIERLAEFAKECTRAKATD